MGYPTRTAAAMALREQGLANAAIAVKLGISHSAVSGLFTSYGRHRERRGPRQPSASAASASDLFPVDVRIALRPAAAKRGMTIDRLISEIIAIVAMDSLADAILDDMGSAIE
jgi:hypothetical protein